MNAAQPLSIPTFIRTARQLTLLASRDHLGFAELGTLLREPLHRSRRRLAWLALQLPLGRAYAGWRLGSQSVPAAAPYYFQVNLAKLQPFYTTLAGPRKVHQTFSMGHILRLYRVTAKRDRRKVEKGPLALRFFKRFLRPYFLRSRTTAVCLGYRRRYAFFLTTALLPFVRRYSQGLVFTPRALTGAFSFRRVKAIKKRIRKRLNSK